MPNDIIRHSLKMYAEERRATGGFLRSVLENDLCGAVAKADHYNSLHIKEIVLYCYNELPACSWGSKEKVERWLNGTEQKDA